MPWFRVDDGFATHPKVLATSLEARGLWVTAGSWSSAHLTDGAVPRHVLLSLGGTPTLAEELVTAGLWRRRRDGYVFHDWSSKNPSRKEVEAMRGKKAAAGRKGGLASGKTRSKNEARASPLVEPPSRSHPGFKTADVINRTNGSYPPELIDSIISEVKTITGRSITEEWAARVAAELLKDRSPASPAAYVRQAIRNEPNPRVRFLPLY